MKYILYDSENESLPKYKADLRGVLSRLLKKRSSVSAMYKNIAWIWNMKSDKIIKLY